MNSKTQTASNKLLKKLSFEDCRVGSDVRRLLCRCQALQVLQVNQSQWYQHLLGPFLDSESPPLQELSLTQCPISEDESQSLFKVLHLTSLTKLYFESEIADVEWLFRNFPATSRIQELSVLVAPLCISMGQSIMESYLQFRRQSSRRMSSHFGISLFRQQRFPVSIVSPGRPSRDQIREKKYLEAFHGNKTAGFLLDSQKTVPPGLWPRVLVKPCVTPDSFVTPNHFVQTSIRYTLLRELVNTMVKWNPSSRKQGRVPDEWEE